MEYLVTFTLAVPEGTPARDVEEATASEAKRVRELAGRGTSSGCGCCPPRTASRPRSACGGPARRRR